MLFNLFSLFFIFMSLVIFKSGLYVTWLVLPVLYCFWLRFSVWIPRKASYENEDWCDIDCASLWVVIGL